MNKRKFYFELAKFALAHPSAGIELIKSSIDVWKDTKNNTCRYDGSLSDLQAVINKLFPENEFSISESKKNLDSLYTHIRNFFESLEKYEYPSKNKPYPTIYNLDEESGLLLYAVCKILKPDVILETGVAYGLGSAFILQALHENKKGKLFSVDGVFRPWQSKEMIGAAIPETLRKRWNIIYGSSSKKLQSLLKSLSPIDIFFHDSLHTYNNMSFEFKTAWPHIKSGGILISDDVGSNDSFHDFGTETKTEPIVYSQKKFTDSYFGIIKK